MASKDNMSKSLSIDGSVVSSAESTSGVAYLDFYQNYIVKKIDKNESFFSERIKITVSGGHDSLLDVLKEYKAPDSTFIIKAFNNKFINIDFHIGYVRIHGLSRDDFFLDEPEETDIENDFTVFITGTKEFIAGIGELLKPYKKK
jgi:hypothetical protein